MLPSFPGVTLVTFSRGPCSLDLLHLGLSKAFGGNADAGAEQWTFSRIQHAISSLTLQVPVQMSDAIVHKQVRGHQGLHWQFTAGCQGAEWIQQDSLFFVTAINFRVCSTLSCCYTKQKSWSYWYDPFVMNWEFPRGIIGKTLFGFALGYSF